MARIAEQMEERRERILEAAREIIAERGFEALTLRELAQNSAVTVPTIYNLIGNKDQVLMAAVAQQTERFLEGIKRAEGDIVPIIDANARELLRVPRYYRSLLRLMMTSEAAAPALRTVAAAMRGQFRFALGELAEGGGIEDWVDLDALTEELQGMLWSTSLMWANGTIANAGLAPRQRYGGALLMSGATHGATREGYARVARDNQPRRRRRRSATVTKLERRG